MILAYFEYAKTCTIMLVKLYGYDFSQILMKGFFDMYNDKEYIEDERYIMDVPTHCPKCGSELEVDTDYDKTRLICSNNKCDYELDATEEFEKAEKAYGLDEIFEND